jgi:tetratricopeptide (TPR) repeat protein
MGFADDFRSVGLTYPQLSLERTIETGFNANVDQLRNLQESVTSVLEAELSRMDDRHEAATCLRSELAYQAEQMRGKVADSSKEIVGAVEHGSQDIVAAVQSSSEEIVVAIQQMTDYLGIGLSEIRWAVERQTQVSKNVLALLLSSLTNESRQYWEQGVACYEAREPELARERFERSLEANRTNSFVYEYLGFIAVEAGDATSALRNFELAQKFAQTKHARALALSHRAQVCAAIGDLGNAVRFSKDAIGAEPEMAKSWYEHAIYSAEAGQVPEAIAAIRHAIELDWNYWGVTIAQPKLDLIRGEVNQALDELRMREGERAVEMVRQFRREIDEHPQLCGTGDLQNLLELEAELGRNVQNNLHVSRAIQSKCRQCMVRLYGF